MTRAGSVQGLLERPSGRSAARVMANSPSRGGAPSRKTTGRSRTMREARCARGLEHPLALAIGQGKDAREDPARRQVPRAATAQ